MTSQPLAPTHENEKVLHTPNHKLSYDSNPFTLTFRGLGLFVDFAKGVFITMVVFGIFGGIFNFATNFADMRETSQSEAEFDVLTNNSDISPETILILALAIAGAVLIVLLISIVVSTAYKGFIAAGAIAASERRTISIGEAINAMADRFGTLLRAELVAALKIIGGFFLLFVPGIRAYLRYQALPYLIMSNKHMTANQALQTSKKLYNKHLMEVFGINTVGSLIPFIGSALTNVGMALSAQQLQAYAAAKKPTPQTHWLNYLGLMLIALVFIGIALLVALLVALYAAN